MSATPHPLESIFSIQPGSTPLPSSAAQVSNEMVDPATGDIVERKTEGVSGEELAKEERIEDLKIDGQIDVIHGAAMTAFEAQARLAQEVDPKFAARNAEVAAIFLKIALDAVGGRVDAKYKRAKIRLSQNEGPRQVQNNLIVADRNSLLQSLFDNAQRGDKIVEQEIPK